MIYNEFLEKSNKILNRKNQPCKIDMAWYVNHEQYKSIIEPLYLMDTSVNNVTEFCKKHAWNIMLFNKLEVNKKVYCL